jgi:hypothetical protein
MSNFNHTARRKAAYKKGYEAGKAETMVANAEPVAWLVKRYDPNGVLLDTELSFVRPSIKSTCKTDMAPLYASPRRTPEAELCMKLARTQVLDEAVAVAESVAHDLSMAELHSETRVARNIRDAIRHLQEID